jgi:hypothetical protein
MRQAQRRAVQAAEERRRAEAQARAERGWLARHLPAAGDTDRIAVLIERSLRQGR